jgi:hypothetical protein
VVNVRKQRLACVQAALAETPEDFERVHLLMRKAFPKLAEAFPCECATCKPKSGASPK